MIDETKGIVEQQIGSCLKGFVRCEKQNREHFFQRIDELFLLWSKVEDISFVKACEDWGIVYYDFHNKKYLEVSNQIKSNISFVNELEGEQDV